MECISVSYKKADLEIRQKIKFSEDVCKEIAKFLTENNLATECVVLSTCNRTEIYYCGEKNSRNSVIEFVANCADIDKNLLSRYIMLYSGDSAVLHLFKVASGIDSMVIGEDEILGQTKTAYQLARDNGTVAYELNMIFQSAISCAKKIKTETAISKTSVSVATLASNEVAKFGDNVNVLVIGASGKIGTTVLKNLLSHKNVSVKATLRNHKLSKNTSVETVDYKDRYHWINYADCIISATSSPHYTVTLYDLKKNLSDDRSRLFIDLAVPPDIDSSIGNLPNVRLINIDYFQKLARENNEIKLGSVGEAEEIISEEISVLKKDMLFHDFLPIMGEVKESISGKPFEEIIYKMKADSSAEVFEDFLSVLSKYRS